MFDRLTAIARNVSENDGADASLAPQFVQTAILFRRLPALIEVVVVPSADALGHGALPHRRQSNGRSLPRHPRARTFMNRFGAVLPLREKVMG